MEARRLGEPERETRAPPVGSSTSQGTLQCCERSPIEASDALRQPFLGVNPRVRDQPQPMAGMVQPQLGQSVVPQPKPPANGRVAVAEDVDELVSQHGLHLPFIRSAWHHFAQARET